MAASREADARKDSAKSGRVHIAFHFTEKLVLEPWICRRRHPFQVLGTVQRFGLITLDNQAVVAGKVKAPVLILRFPNQPLSHDKRVLLLFFWTFCDSRKPLAKLE